MHSENFSLVCDFFYFLGAAFTEGLSSGLSTSVAVFCHELPHELGKTICTTIISELQHYAGLVCNVFAAWVYYVCVFCPRIILQLTRLYNTFYFAWL